MHRLLLRQMKKSQDRQPQSETWQWDSDTFNYDEPPLNLWVKIKDGTSKEIMQEGRERLNDHSKAGDFPRAQKHALYFAPFYEAVDDAIRRVGLKGHRGLVTELQGVITAMNGLRHADADTENSEPAGGLLEGWRSLHKSV